MNLLPLTILLLLHIPFVYSSLPNLNGTSVITPDVLSDSPSSNNTRTLWEIIWSCAATLFACTWTAIHPNIPGMDERKFGVISRRLGIMMFLSAHKATQVFNDAFGAQLDRARSDHTDTEESTATLLHEFSTSDGGSGPRVSSPHVAGRKFRGWTVTHGFFVWMGGFMLYVNDEPRATLTPKELKRFVRKGSVEMPIIVEADIEDRSKGDALSKGIAILQLVWFILQLVARYVQNLPITLLELDTLAVAALTGITYGFWWKKPKDVGRPHAVYWKATAPPQSELIYDKADLVFSSERWGDILSTYMYPLPSLMGLGIYQSPRAAHSRRVPSVGGYDMKRSQNHNIVILLTGCFSGAVFGGIHCLGWNDSFQGLAEQTLWRVASLAIVSAPVSLPLLTSYMIWRGSNDIIEFPAVASSAVYIVARIILI
ncbi:hypothetical protein BDR04DRAFT_1142728, partial [Suillus decipiens]